MLAGPVPQELGNGETTTAKSWLRDSKEMTRRELATGPRNYGMDFIGSADSVAAQMGEAFKEAFGDADGDGFLIYGPMTRRFINEVSDGLAPAQRQHREAPDHVRVGRPRPGQDPRRRAPALAQRGPPRRVHRGRETAGAEQGPHRQHAEIRVTAPILRRPPPRPACR